MPDEAESQSILDSPGIVPVEQDQMPFGHKKVSVPLSLSSDTEMTRSGDRIVFWREPPKQISNSGG
jgi:hypothetical protein